MNGVKQMSGLDFSSILGSGSSPAGGFTPGSISGYDSLAPTSDFSNLTGGDFNFTPDGLNLGGMSGSNGFLGTGMSGMQFAGQAMGGLETLGKLWGGLQMLNLAKKQFAFSKDFSTANMGNQIKSYNTALADRARSRAVMESQTPDQMNSYVSSNSLSMPKSLGGGS